MADKKRPQDKWNEKMGYISKSYKLKKKVTDLFANACELDEVTQAGQLTRLMEHYSIPIERRHGIVYIREKYSSNDELTHILKNIVEISLTQITEEDVEHDREKLIANLSNRPLFSKVSNALEYNKKFDCYSKELKEYFDAGASSIVEYIKKKSIRQITLFSLMNEGILMPLKFQQNQSVEIDINHANGNSIFEVYLDMLPYEQFALIKNRYIIE